MNQIRTLHIIGFFFTIILGTLLHFVYDWFGGTLSAILGAVNESTWEHLKLLFWPALLFTIVEYIRYGKNQIGFLSIKLASILLGLFSIIVLFYTYTGILGSNYLILDITIFIISVFITYYFSYKQIQEPANLWELPILKIITPLTFGALVLFFILFTFRPPHLGLFAIP